MFRVGFRHSRLNAQWSEEEVLSENDGLYRRFSRCCKIQVGSPIPVLLLSDSHCWSEDTGRELV